MKKIRASAAFTLIELLVVTAIITVVTAVVLANHNEYSGQVLLQSFTYDVALSIRQAQIYGISVERYGSGASSNFNLGYGMHFDTTDPVHYELFADAAGNGIYQSSENVAPSPYAINRGYYVTKICAPAGASAAACTALSSLDILYVRPEPDAYIAANGSQCYNTKPSIACQASARIVLSSPRGDTMSITVQANGQISVDQKAIIAP